MKPEILFGKRVLITGATGGIGLELCKQFTHAGCSVFAAGRNTKKLKNLLSLGIAEHFIVFDFENIKKLEDEIENVRSKLENIDILINNAGFFELRSIEKINLHDLNKSFSINVFGPIILTKFCIEGMKKRSWGRVFNIGSSSCYNGGKFSSLYCASKHGLLGFSRSASDELKQYNIRVCNLSPSSTKTTMGEIPLATDQNYETFIEPAEVAKTCVFLSQFNDSMEVREILLNRVKVQ